MKLSIYVALCFVFPIYCMDDFLSSAYSLQCRRACETSVTSHVISMESGNVDVSGNLLRCKIAASRTFNIQSCCRGSKGEKHCNKHSGNDIFLFPDNTGYVEIFADAVEVNKTWYKEPQYLRMPHRDSILNSKENDYIQACALSGNEKVLAAVGGSFLCVWRTGDVYNDGYWYERWNEDVSQLIAKLILINHVALNDSGSRVAVNVVLKKNEGSRILVFDTSTIPSRKPLYNLKGNSDRFFYMLNDNLINDRLDKHCYQYDLGVVKYYWDSLKQEYKDFLYYVYEKYEETKQKVCLKQASDFLSIYQNLPEDCHLKTWLDERVYVEAGWLLGKFLGY